MNRDMLLLPIIRSAFVCALAASTLHAIPAARPLFYCEAHVTPATTPSESNILICYKTCNNLFRFDRRSSAGNSQQFIARYILRIDCADSIGVIRKSSSIDDSILVSRYEDVHSYLYNLTRHLFIPMNIVPYSVRVYIEQRDFRVGQFRRDSIGVTRLPPLTFHTQPIVTIPDTGSVLHLMNTGGGVEFGTRRVHFLWTVMPSNMTGEWFFACRKLDAKKSFFTTPFRESTGRCSVLPHRAVRAYQPSTLVESERISIEESTAQMDAGFIVAELETGMMSPGRYELIIHQQNSTDSLRYVFECHWVAMPASLTKISYAAEAMRYVVPDEEYSYLSDGSESEVRDRLLHWWSTHDPSPTTIYNEAMMAYFRRVDEASQLYVSPTETDGMKTERGKVYILYGAPTSIENRRSASNSMQEVWTYSNKVRKRISFELSSRNLYKITKVEDLR